MSHNLLSLICNPARPALDEQLLGRVRDALSADIEDEIILSPGVAAEFILADAAFDDDGLAKIAAALSDAPVDVNRLSTAARRKKLLVADMDSTIIEQECIDEIGDFAGIKSDIAAITERAMRGELDLETALHSRVALLKDLSADVLQQIIDERITLTPGAKIMAATMAANEARLVLASSGFTFFTERVAARAGFHEAHSNVLGVADGRLTGKIDGAIYGGPNKAETLIAVRDALGASPEEVMAVGDGANDLAMIAEAGTGVAFRAKPAVAKAADCRIAHGDLTGVLYLQGYSDADFIR